MTTALSPEATRSSPPPATGTEAGSPRTWRLVTAGAALVAAVWTGVGIGRRPLWTDETISLAAVSTLGESTRRTGGTMALYYGLLKPWTALVGTSPAAVRTLSVLFVVAMVVATAAVARRLAEPRTAALGLLVLATYPATVHVAQEARSYALASALVAGCWAVLARIVEAADRSDRATALRLGWVLALLGGLGTLAHGMVALQVGAMVASLVVAPQRRLLARAVAPALVVVGVVGGLLMALGAGAVADWVEPLSIDQGVQTATAIVAPSPGVIGIVVALAGAGGFVAVRRGDAADRLQRWGQLAPLWWAAGPLVALVALSLVRPYLVGRYLLPSLPAIALLVAQGAVWAAQRLAGVIGRFFADDRLARRAAAGCVAVVLALTLLDGRSALDVIVKERWPDAAAIVHDRARPGDTIAFTASEGSIEYTTRVPFEVAWRELPHRPDAPVPLDDEEPLGALARFHDAAPAAETTARLAASDRLWIIHKTRAQGRDAPLDAVLTRPAVARDFTEVERWTVEGDIDVVLLQRR